MDCPTLPLLAILVLGLTGCRGSEPATEIQESARSGQSLSVVTQADAIAAAPAHYRVLEEAGGARMLLATWQPGETDAMHSHPTVIWCALTDANLRIAGPGPPLVRAIAAGENGVQGPVAGHAITNIGQNEARILLFEIEPESVSAAGFAAAAPAAELAGGDHQLLESHAGYRLLLAALQAEARSRLHSHPDLLWYALTDTDISFEAVGQSPTSFQALAGDHGQRAAIRAHTARNLATTSVRWLSLELGKR